jgi:F0F1-type ATP synthase assembly protein I
MSKEAISEMMVILRKEIAEDNIFVFSFLIGLYGVVEIILIGILVFMLNKHLLDKVTTTGLGTVIIIILIGIIMSIHMIRRSRKELKKLCP